MRDWEARFRRLLERLNTGRASHYELRRVRTQGHARAELLGEFARNGYRSVELYANWRGDWWPGGGREVIVVARKDWGPGCPTGHEPISLVDRIWIRENGEPLVDMRRVCPRTQVTAKLPYLRERVATMLHQASRQLPRGVRLEVRTCLRTLAVQRRGYEKYLRRLRRLHPDWPNAVLRRESYRFFHPYDHRVPPGHCTGGAVDVLLLGPDDKPLDLDSPFKRELPYCRPDTPGLNASARRHRELLISVMESAGFANCVDEYWHYSYGDGPWAVRMGLPVSWYGMVAPPIQGLRG